MTPTPNQLYLGDAEQILKSWPDQAADLIVTSPPYWNLRDYRATGQIGLEKSPEEWIEHLSRVFRLLRRVLKDSGSAYVNLGDTFMNKHLLGLPWRFALRLAAEGWVLRSAIVWHKSNPMPHGVQDRYLSAYDFVFFLTKKARGYYFNLDAVRVPHLHPNRRNIRPQRRPTPEESLEGRHGGNFPANPLGKNPTDVWSITPDNRRKHDIVPDTEGHFAAFPEALVVRPILASSPPGGVILDPFAGSGTVPVVARRLGRHYLGIDISQRYLDLARRRLDLNEPLLELLPVLQDRYARVTPIRIQNPTEFGLSFLDDAQEAA